MFIKKPIPENTPSHRALKETCSMLGILRSPAPWRQGYHLTYTGFWPKQTPRLFWKICFIKLPVFFGGEVGGRLKRNRKWSWIPVETILRGHGWCKLEWVFCRCVWLEFGFKRNCWCTCKLLVCPHLLFLFLDHVCCVWVIFQTSWGTFFHQDVCWFYIQLSLNDSTCCGNRQHTCWTQ